ncbi:MAG: hypothetical protein WC462_01995 [archaeon]
MSSAKIIKLFNCGDSALLEINKKQVHCFLPDFTELGYSKEWDLNKGKNLEGKIIDVSLFINPLNIDVLSKPAKKINQLQNFRYEISGEIKRKGTKIVVDCGEQINTILPPNYKKLKWAKISGRLDAIINK